MKKILTSIVIVLGLILTLGSQGAYENNLGNLFSDRQTVTIGHTSWDDGLASTHILKHVLEDQGYDVELVQLDPSVLFSSLATGDIDFTSSAWLPSTHGAYIERYQEDIVDMGPHTEGAVTGLVVPSYMEVDSIADLTDESGQIIYGIEPGAGIANQTDQALEIYPNLSGWTHQTSSTGAMVTELEQAINNEEEIVVTGWTPHWMFIQMDLKFLEDPENAYGEGESLQKLSRIGFDEDFPEVHQILDRFELTIDDVGEIMLDLSEDVPPEQAAQDWIDRNPDKVTSWVEGL